MMVRTACILGLLLLGACAPTEPSGLDDVEAVVASTGLKGTTSTSEQLEASSSSMTSIPDAELVGPPAIPTLDLDVIVLDNPTSGGGSMQELAWGSVNDGVRYDVVMFDSLGDLYWSWSTVETSVFMGGVETTLENPPGPQILEGMTWFVLAFDESGGLVAQSEVRAIAP